MDFIKDCFNSLLSNNTKHSDYDNNKSNQCNPNHSQYQGYSFYSGTKTKSDLDNHSNQLNPNNSRYSERSKK